ncbi:MAG: hypothetical protein VW124_17110 [Paracoccaceae bacterium]|jgi:hypothetical protein
MFRTAVALVILSIMTLGPIGASWAQSSGEQIFEPPQLTEKEIKTQCALIGNLTFLAIEKFNKGRKLDDAKDELAGVAETAFKKEEFAAYSDQLRERYNAALLDAFLNERLNPKVFAKKQIRDCIRKNL